MYVRLSGLGGNVIFSASNQDKGLIFTVQIHFTYEYLFCKYFVRRSVGQATKCRNASLLMDVVILVFSLLSLKHISWPQIIGMAIRIRNPNPITFLDPERIRICTLNCGFGLLIFTTIVKFKKKIFVFTVGTFHAYFRLD